MALRRLRAALLLAAAMTAGCSAGAPADRGQRATPKTAAPLTSETKTEARPEAKTPPAASPARPATTPAASADWKSFSHTSAALRSDIAARADAMKQGPVGNRGAELASLRLAATGRDLIDAGSLGGALEALQRAVSLYGRNGYAYLYLAYVNHEQGRNEQAAEFAASARRYLPGDSAVKAELEGLVASIGRNAAATGS